MTTQNTAEAPSNGFMAVLQRKETQIGTLSEASSLLAAAVIAASLTGKKATITLTLTVEPKLGALHFTTKLASRVPQQDEPLCIFYAGPDGSLHRDDPRQRELSLDIHQGGLVEPALQPQEEAKAS